MTGLRVITFGFVALGPAILALFLPETGRAALPEQVVDAEKLDDTEESLNVNDEEQQTQSAITCQQKERL